MVKVLAIIGWVVAVPLLALAWFLAPETTPEQAAAREAARELSRFQSEARVKCSVAIKQGMHDPSSAEWASRASWPVTDSGSFYTIRATYRGSNLFGAIVTETRDCLATRREDSATIIGLE